MSETQPLDYNADSIAIIGMAGRFPGASNVDTFWKNIKAGLETISFFSDAELLAAGLDPKVLENPRYVKAKGILQDCECFDADFFGFPAREAEIMDPQHRLFLECAWEALEHAGYNHEIYSGLIGIYGGCGPNTYFLNNLLNSKIRDQLGDYQLMLNSNNDFLISRVSYEFDLTGPSVTVQTACSTSLVATHLACRSLLDYQCDMALAGGSSILSPEKIGYFYQEGMILSPDGHCRTFDSRAQGTVPSSGVGLVVLKRLKDALSDGDYIHAVIRGSAINNDGKTKAGFAAPGIAGQAKVIALALATAEVEPKTITYIEAHGTGTPVGDPIELKALRQIFGKNTDKKRFCAIGSVKTNIGHSDTAAGIAGLIKTTQALAHQQIPPSLHFTDPNPYIDFDNNPFYVNTELSNWKKSEFPRRAGVSSFGIGGANAHVVLEEAPELGESIPPPRLAQLWIFSARTPTALKSKLQDFVSYLYELPDKLHSASHMADIAYTLAIGRKAFDYRAAIICRNVTDAMQRLTSLSNATSIEAMEIDLNVDQELTEIAQSWLSGASIDWKSFYNLERRRRVPLPTYPFERQRYWIDPPAKILSEEAVNKATELKKMFPLAGAQTRPSFLKQQYIPAKNETEEKLAKIWQQCLGFEDIGAEDNFFDLGGNSVMAVQLIEEMCKEFNISILLKDFSEQPTIRNLADHISCHKENILEKRSEVISFIRVNEKNDANIFLIHPAGGTTLCYSTLNRFLNGEYNLLGVDLPEDYQNYPSMEELGSYYWNEIRRYQEKGPYIVGGWSFGGNLAYEIAVQIERDQQQVTRVIMFDSFPPSSYNTYKGEGINYDEIFPDTISKFFTNKSISKKIKKLCKGKSISQVFEFMKKEKLIDTQMNSIDLLKHFDKWVFNHHSLKKYFPHEKINASLIYFEAEDQDDPDFLNELQMLKINLVSREEWKKYFNGSFMKINTAGNHHSIFGQTENLKNLAKSFDEIFLV